MDRYSYIANAHGSYVEELYKAYLQNPGAVDESWRKFFEGFEFAENYNGNGAATSSLPEGVSAKEVAVSKLIFAYRSRAHLRSKTNPVRQRKSRNPWLDLELFGLSEADLDTTFQAGNELGIGAVTLRKIIDTLKYIYEGTIGFEFTYIREPEVFDWLRHKFEKDALAFNPSLEFKKRILKKLNEAVVF
jgi:2-oxoglutarate dehydrogenase E1 component